MDAQIQVLIADPQPLFRAGLERAIRQDVRLRLVAEADDGRAALAAIRRLRPDVAVLDIDLPALGGRAVVDAVAQAGLATAIVLLTADVRPDVAFDAIAAGARGYLSKRVDDAVVRDAVCRVAAGGTALCAALQTLIAREIRLRHADDRRLLSERELEVLALIAQGATAPEIGRALHLATPTVKSYVARVYQRLGVRDRAQAVYEGMRRGLLD
jgi:two-component system nitrate/nitrite response regulator NarL